MRSRHTHLVALVYEIETLLSLNLLAEGISVVLLLWACLVIRKSTQYGWTSARVLLTIFLFELGFAGTLVVVRVA